MQFARYQYYNMFIEYLSASLYSPKYIIYQFINSLAHMNAYMLFVHSTYIIMYSMNICCYYKDE